MYFVYFLRSMAEGRRSETYVGMSKNPIKRRYEHNTHDDRRAHTFKFRPWTLDCFVLAENEETAGIIEKHFKSGAGKEKIKNYLEAHTESLNPINDYFMSLKVGKGFGNTARGTRFKVVENDGVPLFARVRA